MRSSARSTRAWLVVLVGCALGAGLAACKKEGKRPNATRGECEQYRNKMFSLLPEDEQKVAAGMNLDKPTPLEIELCMERITSEEVACALAASTQDEALACKPSVDIRPADARRTPEECAAYSAHLMKLAETFTDADGGPPLTPAMAKMAARECERWLTKQRFDCVMKAQSPMGLMGCKP